MDDTMDKEHINNIDARINEGIRNALQYEDPDDSIDSYLGYIGRLFNADRVYVFERDEELRDTNTYEWVNEGTTSEKHNLQKLPPEVCKEWYDTFNTNDNSCITIRNTDEVRNETPLRSAILCSQNIRSLVVVPLYDEDRTIGFYGVDNYSFESAEKASAVLQLMSYFIVSCIKRRNLIKEMIYAGNNDTLTGFGNRYSFNRQMELAKDEDNVVCVVLDVNNLKLCNDRYGHEEGDRLIKDAAVCINASFGKRGKCFRVGGDEFYVFLYDCTITDIHIMEEELNCRIREVNEGRKTPLSIAYGYNLREKGEELDHLVNRSDERMYEMKYRMKQEFPVYCEERIKNYRMVLEILSKTTDDYLYMYELSKGENTFFGDIHNHFAIGTGDNPTINMEELFSIVHPDDVEELQNDFMRLATGQSMVHNMNYRWINRDNEPVWINCRGKVINDDKGKPFVMIGRVSDTALKYMINLLTGLFNESKYMKDMRSAIVQGEKGWLLFIRINDLNGINLEYGREYGDKIIKNLALTLEIAAKGYKIYHMESVYFCICIPSEDEAEVQQMYDRISRKRYNIYQTAASAVKYGPGKDENRLFIYGKQEILKAQSHDGEYEKVMFIEDCN